MCTWIFIDFLLFIACARAKGETSLLGIEYNPNIWLEKAVKRQENEKETEDINIDRIRRPNLEKTIVREIVKEKEVIVKIRCPYCHKVYDETIDKWSNCSASR